MQHDEETKVNIKKEIGNKENNVGWTHSEAYVSFSVGKTRRSFLVLEA